MPVSFQKLKLYTDLRVPPLVPLSERAQRKIRKVAGQDTIFSGWCQYCLRKLLEFRLSHLALAPNCSVLSVTDIISVLAVP